MLVLTRRVMESIVINGNIKITVYRVEKGRVRLGIEAPREIKIVRPEQPEACNPQEAQP